MDRNPAGECAESAGWTGKGLAANVMELAPRWLVLGAGLSSGRCEHSQHRRRYPRRWEEALSLVIGGLNHEHALIFANRHRPLLQVFLAISPLCAGAQIPDAHAVSPNVATALDREYSVERSPFWPTILAQAPRSMQTTS